MLGSTLRNRYQIIKFLVKGGFGYTYLAKDLDLPGHPYCVVKHLQPQDRDPTVLSVARRLFETEAKILYNNELPAHPVNVAPFLMAKYQVTQAQWRAVADLPKVKIELNANPSYFKGDNLPVEQVNWYDAGEFCARLSRHTGNNYRLPSEAEWEYACQAGTTTPFYFGETVTSELVNYNGNYPYGAAPQGIYREKTTPIGSFPANSFGLYDMHGNVWEWCQDVWHDNYDGAPTDGSAWETNGDDKYRLLRGGAWCYLARDCRAARRDKNSPNTRNSYVGFRLVCS